MNTSNTDKLKKLKDGFDIKAGHPESGRKLSLQIRALNIGGLSKMLELQTRVHNSLEDRDQFVFTTKEECEDSLKNDICLGVFDGDDLVAAAILVVNRDSPRNIGKKMGYDPLASVTCDSVFVSSRYRGLGMQKYLLRVMLELAEELGADHAFATVSPGNIPSLRNLKDMGFDQIYRGIMYENFDRLVMMRRVL